MLYAFAAYFVPVLGVRRRRRKEIKQAEQEEQAGADKDTGGLRNYRVHD